MEDETVEAAPSEENGNIPLDTPSEPVETETPAVVEEPTEPVVELYELPDGRKVDAETLSREWKENFYPDYTRKSQALAAKETPLETPAESKFSDPKYVPQTYEEILQEAEARALRTIEGREQARVEAQRTIENAVETQLSEIKKTDATLDENALFVHANKYGFRDLKQAHQNMKDMRDVVKTVKQATAKDIAKRVDPVSVSPGATGAKSDPSQFATARDFLRSLK